MEGLLTALKYLGPLAVVVWLIHHTYTKLIPGLIRDFRDELAAFRSELAAERDSRERMLAEERLAREAFTRELGNLGQAIATHNHIHNGKPTEPSGGDQP